MFGRMVRPLKCGTYAPQQRPVLGMRHSRNMQGMRHIRSMQGMRHIRNMHMHMHMHMDMSHAQHDMTCT